VPSGKRAFDKDQSAYFSGSYRVVPKSLKLKGLAPFFGGHTGLEFMLFWRLEVRNMAKYSLIVTLKPGTSSRDCQSLMTRLSKLPGVKRVGSLECDEAIPEIPPYFFVDFSSEPDLKTATSWLQKTKLVEEALAPPARKMAIS
jgi:hypothetical protein